MHAANARYAPGTVIGGRYRLVKMLGEGGMGVVHEALIDGRADQRIAVKMLHDEMAANPAVVERFLAEGDVCRRLDHPGILRVHDVGHERGVPYLVMDLLLGRSLIEYTEHHQRLPVNFAVTVIAGVLHALDYAHSMGIVHRDLKPENVFLVPGQDGQYHTKLLDFGIAKCIDAAGGARRKTATGVLLGTPGYMSPEQVKGARNVDHRADLWAIGVMFYEMITGVSPFPSDGDDPNNIWGLISAVLTKEPKALSTHDPHFAPFDAFILKALAKDITRRYETAREMSSDLLAIARGETPKSLSQPPGPYTQEQRRVPINSQGDLPNIPPLMGQQPQRQVQMTPISGDTVAANSTMPTGGKTPTGNLASTTPMAPEPMRQQFAPYPTPPVQPSNLQATALAPDLGFPLHGLPAAPTPVPGSPLPPSSPRFGTSPSGFAPKVPPAPPRSEAQGGGGMGVLPWIVLGVFLVGGLVGAIVWALS